MDLMWAHTLVEGYFTVVPLQWAHGQDILGDLWVPTWYLTLISPTFSAHIMKKSLPYPIYTTGIIPNAHAWVFWKVI